MDCNKEEALRAKALAEKKLQLKDFQGARKIAQKAQQLYSDVENISQMIMVCDVHCSAEKKLFGTETDWYGILQIEQTADEATIKKQYRKFALQLHPDKNKFPGAEAAFKLVGEAQRILLDREKRIVHDNKRSNPSRASAPYRPPPRANTNPTNGVQNNFKGSFPGCGAQYQPPTQPAHAAFPNGREAFWTMCPFCSVKYQYYREFVNRSLSCQTCLKKFIAYDLKLPGVSPMFSATRPAFHQQGPSSKAGFSKVEIGPRQAAAAATATAATAVAAAAATEKVRYNTSFTTGAGASGVNNKKRGRMHEDQESSESFDSDSSTDSDEDVVMGENGQVPEHHGSEHVRRSTRQKKNISYKENISDDENDPMSPLKSNKSSGQPSADVEDSKGSLHDEEASKSDKQGEEGLKRRGNGSREEVIVNDDGSESDSPSTKEPEPEVHEYPDPDFSDFDKDRQEDCFRAGQVWAAYDVLDGMPRFYARIRKVVSRRFKLQITWLEADPDDENEKKWVHAGLPVSCGKFRHGKSDVAEERSVFSHIVSWEKGRERDTYIIYPCVGETWAMFKNWDIQSYPVNPKEFEYEFFEILSEYTKEDGVHVGYLSKLKGFASVFARTVRKGASFYIQPAELYRFGHKVPSFRLLDDKEGEGVPKGSFELDPASVPVNLEAVEPEELEVNAVKVNHEADDIYGDTQEHAQSYENGAGDYGLSSSDGENGAALEDSAPKEILIPDADFHNFDEDKSLGNFKHGQIWAVYADEDSLPKYYGKITKIDSGGQEFELHLRWLSCCLLPENATRWHDKDMLISCGTFKVKKGRPQVYTCSDSFSHLVKAEPVKGKLMFAISPKKGEVWAMYRKWDPGMTCSVLEGCEYDIVEVIEETESCTKALALERVEGFTSVFKPQLRGGSEVRLEIPVAELLRFSHQVPAFRLTEERNGSLGGFLELDPAALPLYFFSTSK